MMRISKLLQQSSFSIMALVVCLSSCSKLDDIYDPSRLQEAAKENFPVKNVDPNHTWEMVALCNATVTINENVGEECTINFYNGNPYSKTENASLLAQVNAKGGQSVEKTFDIPSALSIIYVTKVNKNGYSSTVPTVVEDGKISASFGATAENVARSRVGVMTRAVDGVWTPEEKYKNISAVPAGLKEFSNVPSDQDRAEGDYTVTNNVTGIKIQHPLTLYITGNNVNLNSFTGAGSAAAANIIIMPGAVVTFNNSMDYNNINCHIYNLGTINLKKGCNLSNIKFYNKGTINSDAKMDLNNATELINEGTINCKDLLTLSNGQTVLDNQGQINAKNLNTEGSSKFYNEGTGVVTIEETTKLNSNACTWNNDGSFTTQYMNLAATSKNWTNSCKLYVTEKMTIATSSGKFNMNGGSYAEIKNLYMDMSRINMGSEAYIYITNEAKFKFNSYNQYYLPGSNGIYGIGEKPALVRMNKVVAENIKQRGTITYYGNLKVACDDHFEMGHDDSNDSNLESANIMIVNGATMSKEEECDIHLEETTCRPGYKPTVDPTPVPEETECYTYAFEDMTQNEAGDYDMNDVVLRVSAPIDGKVTVTLVAAGAIRDLSVYWKDQLLFGEVHESLGAKRGEMVNTGTGITKGAVKATIQVNENFSFLNDGDFYIKDLSNNRKVHIAAFTDGFKKGEIPYAIRIPGEWKYPTERTKITEAYPSFEIWAKDANQEASWYNEEPVEGTTY